MSAISTWAVLRHDMPTDSWHLVNEIQAHTASQAFTRAVFPATSAPINPQHVGKNFKVVNLEGSANFAVDLQIRDLDAPANPLPF